jgi:steroid delta-isomerase-like uncharacterized protein
MAGRETIEAHIRSFNDHDANAWGGRYSADAVLHDPQYPDPLRGRAAIQKDVEDFFTAFPDIQFTLTNTVVSGDLAALEGTATGTHRGPMETPSGPVPATNKTVTMGFAAFVQLDAEGRITAERRYYDVAGLLQQLGLMGQPAA